MLNRNWDDVPLKVRDVEINDDVLDRARCQLYDFAKEVKIPVADVHTRVEFTEHGLLVEGFTIILKEDANIPEEHIQGLVSEWVHAGGWSVIGGDDPHLRIPVEAKYPERHAA